MKPSLAELKELLGYDPATGLFCWLVDRGRLAKAGGVAGTLDTSGHLQIRVFGRKYMAHRLAWLFTHGTWPLGEIDHKNLDATDNRITNLREAQHVGNKQNRKAQANCKSGIKGVYWHKKYSTWVAQINAGGKRFHIGHYPDIRLAEIARAQAAVLLHGEFARF